MDEQEKPLFVLEQLAEVGSTWGDKMAESLSKLLIARVPEERSEAFWVQVKFKPQEGVEYVALQDEEIFTQKVNEILGRNLCPWRVEIVYGQHKDYGLDGVLLLMNTVSLTDIMAFGA